MIQRVMPLAAGTRLGPYEIVAALGVGGMGEVWKARDARLNRYVAIKILPAGKVLDVDHKRRFAWEARAASALNHPNIVQIYDVVEQEGSQCIVMEYVEAKTLGEIIGHKPLPLRAALGYAVEIAAGLASAHAAGIVHRDLKPGNILVRSDGTVKLVDFGLAKQSAAAASADGSVTRTVVDEQPRTAEGVIVGTVSYMSPEQAEGKEVDARSDIFSFGAVLYEMITGQRAFQGGSAISTLTEILHKEPQHFSERLAVPRELERLVFWCLRKDVERRIAHMDDVKVALEDLRQEISSSQMAAAHSVKRRRRVPLWTLAGVAAAVGIVVLAAWLLRNSWNKAAAPELVFSRLTYDSGLTTTPTLSRDGKTVAYSSDREGGPMKIWLQHVAGGQAIRLTSGNWDDYQPSFSPDGSEIVYRSEKEDGGVYLISSLGGESRLIAPHGRDPRFSPDGKLIVYWEGDWGTGLQASVYVVPVSGGQPKRIAGQFEGARRPLWSADGRYIVFAGTPKVKDYRRTYGYYVVPLEGGEPVHIATQPGETISDWTPDGQAILMRSGPDISDIYTCDLASGSARGLARLRRLTSGSGVNVFPSGSPDRFAFASLRLARDVWTVPAVDHEVAPAAPQRLTTSGLAMRPSVDAGGNTLLYLTNPATDREIWSRDLRTGKESRLVANGNPNWPLISPDGSRFAYVDSLSSMTQGVVNIKKIQGGLPEKICEQCGKPSSWSPDGTRILLDNGIVKPFASVVDIKDHRVTEMVRVKTEVDSPAFSPDGTWIAFVLHGNSLTRQIFIAPARPSQRDEWIAVTDGSGLDRVPRWSADGNVLYFTSKRDGFLCIWGQHLTRDKHPAGATFPVAHFHSARLSAEVTDTDPLGVAVTKNQIAIMLNEQTGNIWLAHTPPRK